MECPGYGLGTLCGLFGYSRQSYYKWDNREFAENAVEPLIVEKVSEYRKNNPGLGCAKLYLIVKRLLPLLLVGDEQESMIDRYLERGEMYVMQDMSETPVAVAVVTDEGDGVLELKNIAVDPRFQGKGYGREMIEYLCRNYRGRFRVLTAGTGDSMKTMSFYRNCGFTWSHTVEDFFVKNYDYPIIEEGRALKDMVYFKRNL